MQAARNHPRRTQCQGWPRFCLQAGVSEPHRRPAIRGVRSSLPPRKSWAIKSQGTMPQAHLATAINFDASQTRAAPSHFRKLREEGGALSIGKITTSDSSSWLQAQGACLGPPILLSRSSRKRVGRLSLKGKIIPSPISQTTKKVGHHGRPRAAMVPLHPPFSQTTRKRVGHPGPVTCRPYLPVRTSGEFRSRPPIPASVSCAVP